MYVQWTKTMTLALMLAVALTIGLLASRTLPASIYGGGGIDAGLNAAAGLGGIETSTDIKALIIKLVEFALNIVLVLAIAAVIVAGIYLIVSNGDEGQKDKAKNIIIYALVGIILILFSRVIVLFVNRVFS